MYSTKLLLTKENIYRVVTAYQIFNFYLPGVKVGKAIISPLREDKNPSFGLFINKTTNELVFNDFGAGGGDVFKFVAILYNISYKNALRKINNDLQLGLYDIQDKTALPITFGSINKNLQTPTYSETQLKIKKRNWNDNDVEYWNQFNISIQLLEKSNTYPISHFKVNNKIIEAHRLAYSYDFYYDNVVFRRKIYQPLHKKIKWVSNITSKVIDGIKEIPKEGDLLIITKSRKDRLVLKSLGYDSIATNNESSFIPETNFEKLRNRYDEIILFFDNDTTGIKYSNKFSEDKGIRHILIPNTDVKDISDYIKLYGIDEASKLLNKLI